MTRILTRQPAALNALLGELLFRGLDSQRNDGGQDIISSKNEIEFLGSNNKNILFIVDNSEHVYFAPEAEKAFFKTLTALKLRLEDVAVFNVYNAGLSTFEDLRHIFKSKKMIFLECAKSIFPEIHNLKKNEILDIDQTKVLHTDSLDAMLSDLKKKKEFWLSIKKMFPKHG